MINKTVGQEIRKVRAKWYLGHPYFLVSKTSGHNYGFNGPVPKTSDILGTVYVKDCGYPDGIELYSATYPKVSIFSKRYWKSLFRKSKFTESNLEKVIVSINNKA